MKPCLRITSLLVVGLLFVSCWASDNAHAQFDFEQEPIKYSDTSSHDAVAQLMAKLESGETSLTWSDQQGWLPSLLEKLEVPTQSQTLVFSKTSLQIRHISPQSPRAIYFNDVTYLGWVPTAEFIEVSSVDDHLGAVFYTIRQRQTERPEIARDHTNCMTCHGTAKTKHVPGFLVRSVFPSDNGQPHYSMGSTTTDQQTPFKERFGGWYLTGDLGDTKHRGNKFAERDAEEPFDWKQHANIETASELFESKRYLETTSDVVALMVLEHQAQMHNMITRAAYETRQTIHYQQVMNRVLDRDVSHESESTVRRIKSAGDELLKYLLFAGEAKIESPITSTSDFANQFSKLGPAGKTGRSLREFDLQTRLFRYPCSFLIYSNSFDSLPPRVLDYTENRLIKILSNQDDDPAFDHLSDQDRSDILEILLETKPSMRARVNATVTQ